MTLGRSSTGAIKIKTDSPGLRAVECGCCGVDCGCGIQIEEPLLSVLRAATTGTCNGVAPVYFNTQGGGFSAMWDAGNFISYSATLQANSPCFSIYSIDFNAVGTASDPVACCPSGGPFDPLYCTPAGFFTVNGLQIPALNFIYDENEPLIPTATFVFS
jgi:hypothetical protein